MGRSARGAVPRVDGVAAAQLQPARAHRGNGSVDAHRLMRRALALCAALALGAAVTRARADGDEPYAGLVPLAGDSHQHAATFYMFERSQKDPPVPGFPKFLHENSSPA